MSVDERAKQLHDRSSRGEQLSQEERAILDAWYARLDAEEFALLAPRLLAAATPEERVAFDALIRQIQETSRNIELIAAQNEELRARIQTLRDLLAQRGAAQPT